MSDEPLVSRRTVLKNLAAGVAVAGVSARLGRGAPAPSAPATAQPFTLPPLPYASDALEPHFDARTMEIHHAKHHQAYITNANQALADFPALKSQSGEELLAHLETVPEAVRPTVRNNVGGHVNHAFFWETLAPAAAAGAPDEKLAGALTAAFGSIDQFKVKFAAAALGRFGSGWAWLAWQQGALAIMSTANQDSPLTTGAIPLLGLDVWEHAYYLKFQNRRADYIAEFWAVVNWPRVSARLARLA